MALPDLKAWGKKKKKRILPHANYSTGPLLNYVNALNFTCNISIRGILMAFHSELLKVVKETHSCSFPLVPALLYCPSLNLLSILPLALSQYTHKQLAWLYEYRFLITVFLKAILIKVTQQPNDRMIPSANRSHNASLQGKDATNVVQ